jgi:hypothetical protein
MLLMLLLLRLHGYRWRPHCSCQAQATKACHEHYQESSVAHLGLGHLQILQVGVSGQAQEGGSAYDLAAAAAVAAEQ